MTPEEKQAFEHLRPQVTREEHQAVVQRLGVQEKNMAQLTANVESLTTAVKMAHEESRDHFSKLHSRLDNVTDSVTSSQKVNWNVVIGLGALFLLGIGALGSAGISVTNPIAQNTNRNSEWISSRSDEMRREYYQLGENSARLDKVIEDNKHLDERIHKIELKGYDIHIQSLEKQINSIDTYGSRKLIEDKE